jgi:hypothetical protein
MKGKKDKENTREIRDKGDKKVEVRKMKERKRKKDILRRCWWTVLQEYFRRREDLSLTGLPSTSQNEASRCTCRLAGPVTCGCWDSSS